jgi:uncharacterized membrane protein
MKERLIPSSQARAALYALILASTLCCALVGARAVYLSRSGETGEFRFLYLVWNLFLAWVPLAAAVPLYAVQAGGRARPLASGALAVVWFLFFPNAPYIITDVVHLYERPPVPYWFDIITIMAFALTGLFLGYLSLYLVQEVVRSRGGRIVSWIFAFGMLALSSLGIYFGRFLRWNSWDVLVSPLETLGDAMRMMVPGAVREAVAFSATFFAFSLVCYLIVYSFTHLHAWVERSPVAAPAER